MKRRRKPEIEARLKEIVRLIQEEDTRRERFVNGDKPYWYSRDGVQKLVTPGLNLIDVTPQVIYALELLVKDGLLEKEISPHSRGWYRWYRYRLKVSEVSHAQP